MSETKQSGVEYFANEVYRIIENYDVDKMRYHIEKAHKQAEEINKAQHSNTWGNALSAVAVDKWESFEQYYNKTYGDNHAKK